MKVKDLISELSKINPNFEVTISVGRCGERDLIEKVGDVICINPKKLPDRGYVELSSSTVLDWYRSKRVKSRK